jgi:pimeloyl-ACP methyl ester carboxylesterase
MKRTAGATAVLTVAVLGIATLGIAGTAPAAGVHTPMFEPMACPDGVFPEDRVVDCGFIRVPQDRRHPHAKQITVAAAVVHASVDDRAADPIVFLDGGPSFGAIDPFALDLYFVGAPYAEDHDLVLVDTRGTGLSTPYLGCPELDEALVKAFYSGPTVASHSLRIYRNALRDCWDRLVSSGVDPSDFSSAESAADLEDLRRALAVDEWNLLAVSADGVLGLTYMRLFPHGIRSAIVDSGQSPNMLWGLDHDRGLAEMLESIFSACRANAVCQSTYPGIRRAFHRKLARLNRHPVTFSIPDFLPRPVRLRVDGAGLLTDTLTQIWPGDLSFPEGNVHNMLDFAWRTTHGDLVGAYRDWFGTGPVENDHVNDVLAQGKTMSYVCRDLVSFITPPDLRQAVRDLPAMAPRYLDSDFDLADAYVQPMSPAGCRYWPVGRADSAQHRVVRSAIPTLVLTSTYDVGVPPTSVRPMLPGLSRSTYVELPASAHLQLASYTIGNDCARAIANAFLADPAARPDTSCVDELPPLDLTPPVATRQRPRDVLQRPGLPADAWMRNSR